MNSRAIPKRATGDGLIAPCLKAVARFLRWYGRRLKQMAVFAAGYTLGGIVVAVLIGHPMLAFAIAAWALVHLLARMP